MKRASSDASTARHRLALLRAALSKMGVHGLLIPMTDEYQGEYIPANAKRLEWLTGFDGSAGMAVVLKNKAALFVDGRYTLQAKAQVNGKLYEIHNSADLTPAQWILGQGIVKSVGYDPWLHTADEIARLNAAGVRMAALKSNPIDALWKNRPAPPNGNVLIHPVKYAGESAESKRARMAAIMKKKKVDAALLTLPESIMWLLNIRGNDVPMTPFALCYALLQRNGGVKLYIGAAKVTAEVKKHLGSKVSIRSRAQMIADLKALGKSRKAVLVDKSVTPVWFIKALGRAKILAERDICTLPKACKNATEVRGMRNAHIRDGLAESRFLCWLNEQVEHHASLTEMSVAEKLESFRVQAKEYRGPSFSTIAGAGPHGAIVHYRVTQKTNRRLEMGSLLLLDSGGQYPDGTTDITRTIAIGTPTREMQENFTRVLKGHIALARAVFPKGTTGSQLDALARLPLWEAGLDYDHGTGHGVGSYLSVHEGPQRISKRGNDAVLMPGMILSNEPGCYREGAYGIRIENLVLVVEKPEVGKNYYGFETLTLVPIDRRCILSQMLSEEEKRWLNDYHARVFEAHKAKLTEEERKWLERACAPI